LVIIYDNILSMWEVIFFNEKIEQQILRMPRGIRVRLLKLLELMEQHGPNLGMPHTRSMGNELFEIRAKAKEGLGRFFYCTKIQNQIVILHSFIKKEQKTPKKHLEIAQKRLREVKLWENQH